MAAKQASTQYHSFLLRLWREEAAGAPTSWQGEIESIQTGQKRQFADLETMCDLLRAQVLGESAEESDQEKSDARSLK